MKTASPPRRHRHRHPEAHRFLKLVRWSEEDGAYVGSCPPLVGDCCHADTEGEVIDRLVEIVDEWIDEFKKEARPLPEGTNCAYSGKLTLRVDPGLHRALALRARANGASLNAHIETSLARSLTTA